MKRVVVTLLALITLSAPVALANGTAMAVNVFSDCGQGSVTTDKPDVCQDADNQSGNNGKNDPVIDIIKKAINIISFVIGIAAVIGIVVSGVRIMVAGGDSQAVASARTGLIYSLVGLAVAAIAQAIVAFVLSQVGN